METIFLNAANVTQFVRDDMESGNWQVEEYSVRATFPFDPGKVIMRGMRIGFRDPATNVLQVFEIRNVRNDEPDHSQQITAEHIVVSELTDDHIEKTEISGKTAAQALGTVLSGTLWSVGTNTASGTSSADIGRGDVWQAVNTIAKNWNVYITPRVVISDAGAITGRYLDISPHQGTWRGVRLSIDKNDMDSSVVYDDSNVVTAMFGYGGMIEVENQTAPNTSKELTFEDVVWTATGGHPAKPAGQKYLDYPEKTALYGRNGRPRYGYYQNADITDANILIQKTWEMLQTVCDPIISITGTVSCLYRMGYKDEPIQLHDLAIVEIRPTGETFQKQIIRLDVDLVDPTNTKPEIGDYIPNIIYINRETNSYAMTGEAPNSGGGGGGGHGQSNSSKYQYDTYSELVQHTDEYGSMIAMVVGKYNGNEYIKAAEIGLAINKTGDPGNPYETRAYINADHVNISATTTNYSLAGELERTADGKLLIKSAGGMYVQRTESGTTASFGVWDNGNLTGGVMVQHINGQTGTITRLKGDIIVIGSDQTIDPTYRGKTLDGTLTQITSDFTSVNTLLATKIEAEDVTAELVQSRISAIATLATNTVMATGLITSTLGVAAPTIAAGTSIAINGNSFSNLIVSASVSGNTLTLTPLTGSAVTFSKATSLTGAWSGGIFTVTASPQGNTLSTELGEIATNGTPTTSGNYTMTIPCKVILADGTTTVLTDNITVAASDAYNNGVSAGYSTGYSAGYTAGESAGYGSGYSAGYSAGYTAGAASVDTTAYFNAGWNACLAACGIAGGGVCYTGTWYGTLYVAPTGGATPVYNCVGQATGHSVDAK